MTHRSLFGLSFFFLCLFASLAVAGPRPVRAYVVLSGEVLSIDLDSGRILKRLDFSECVGMADKASLVNDEIVVTGMNRRATRGLLRIDPRRMNVRHHSTIPDSPTPSLPGDDLSPHAPKTLKLSQRPSPRAPNTGLELIFTTESGQQIDLEVDKHPVDSPFEALDLWTISPDTAKLLVLSKGGFKYQSYLRIYDYPSLRKLKTVPLMRIRDHVPVALFVM